MINYSLKLICFLINSQDFEIQLCKVPYIRLWQILNHGKSRNELRSLILSHSVCDLKNVAISVANAPSTATNLKITNWLRKNCVTVTQPCEISLEKFVIDVCKSTLFNCIKKNLAPDLIWEWVRQVLIRHSQHTTTGQL